MSHNNQLAQATNHWRKFCQCVLSGQTDNLEMLRVDSDSDEKFIRFLHHQGIEALILDLAELHNCADLIPDHITQKLIELRRLASVKEVYRKQHLGNLLEILRSNQIDCLILKGTALAYGLYQKPYQRSRLDTDILIQSEDKNKTDQILIANGFSKALNISGELVSHQNTYWQTDDNIKHAYDIHWRISNRNAYAIYFDFAQLYSDKSQLSALGTSAFGLGLVDALLHSTVHYFGHRSNERDRLIWIYDLHLLCNRFSDNNWSLLLKKSQLSNLDPLVYKVLEISNENFKTIIPEQILHQLAMSKTQLSSIETKRINNNQWSRIDQFKSDWAILNFNQRCRLIKEHLLPPSEFILEQNNSSSKILLPYFYLKRIVIGGAKLLTNKNKY